MCEHLAPNQAADRAAAGLDIFLGPLRNSQGKVEDDKALGRAIVAISPRLDTATAARAAETLTGLLCHPKSVPFKSPPLATALVAVCQRLPAADAAAHINRSVDFLIAGRKTTKAIERSNYIFLTMALDPMCEGLDAPRASRVANAIVAILGDRQMVGDYKLEYIRSGHITVLTKAAKCLDPPGGLQAAEDLVLVLRKANSIVMTKDELRAAMVTLCGRLDTAGSARVAEAMTAAVRDPKTTMLARTVYADAFAVIAVKLTPAQVASLERTLVDSLLADMNDAKSLPFSGLTVKALGTTSGRPGATSAPRVAEALGAAISDSLTPLSTLDTLAAALTEVCAQLPPREASTRVNRTLDVLESLWKARTAPRDRASIAAAQMALWKHLDRADADARALQAAAYLVGAAGSQNPNTGYLRPRTRAVSRL